MEVGLACHVCGQLNLARAQTCTRCGTVVAPTPVEPPRAPQAAGAAAPPVVAPPPGSPQPPQAAAPPAAPPPAAAPPAAAPPAAAPPAAAPPAAASPQPRFDPATGQPLQPQDDKPVAKTMFFGALQQEEVTPRLVVIKGEGGDGVTYHLTGTTQTIGRNAGDIQFGDDVFLSPEHAKFTVQNGRLFVQDLESTNGVFLRIKRPTPLDDQDLFLVGEQLLQLDSAPLAEYGPNDDGTYFYGSARPDAVFRVTQLLAGGGEGLTASARGATLSIGREGNVLDFPTDRFISGHHAQLDQSSDTGQVILTDTGSRNGTFVRIKAAQELFHGDYLFVGQQLFRVEIS
jgi:pSer/pThr/pTyr-binding forkhead associated (FHA) protein